VKLNLYGRHPVLLNVRQTTFVSLTQHKVILSTKLPSHVCHVSAHT